MADMCLCQAEIFQTRGVRREIVAHRGHDQRTAAQHLQVVGDVARASAVFAAHFRHQERDVEDMDLLGQDVFFELVFEYHDGVVSHGTANQCVHRYTQAMLNESNCSIASPPARSAVQQITGVSRLLSCLKSPIICLLLVQQAKQISTGTTSFPRGDPFRVQPKPIVKITGEIIQMNIPR